MKGKSGAPGKSKNYQVGRKKIDEEEKVKNRSTTITILKDTKEEFKNLKIDSKNDNEKLIELIKIAQEKDLGPITREEDNMKIISVVNQKGGVGKTATSVNLAHGLVRNGKKVLLIDFDPQGHSTLQCKINTSERKYLVYDLLKSIDTNNGVTCKDVICTAENGVDLLPTDINMSNADIIISGFPAKELKLKKILKKSDLKYDFVIIDCPPTLNVLTYNALAASNEVLVPLQAETSSLDGIAQLLNTISVVKEDINENLKINGVLLTMVDRKLNMYKDVCNAINQYFGNLKYNAEIRRNTKISEAYGARKTIFEYDSTSTGALDYNNFIKEFLEREV